MERAIEKIGAALEKAAPRQGDRIVLGLSGGLDSVALLHALIALGERFGYQLIAAHLNHHLRGAESDRDERFVRDLCSKLGVMVVVEHARELGGATGNLEERAREVRYWFLESVAAEFNARYIALAHQADDQAETVLLRLMRGAGAGGLRAMRLVGPGKLIRPALKCWRSELAAYLNALGASYVEDSSNRLDSIVRNRLRNHLIPMLERDYAPRLKGRLGELADEMGEVDDLLSQLARIELCRLKIADGALDLERFARVAPALESWVLREYVMETTGSLRGFSRAHIGSLRRLALDGPPNGRLDLPRGWEARREYKRLMVVRAAAADNEVERFAVAINARERTVVEAARICFESEVVAASEVTMPTSKFEALFDAEQVERSAGGLMARTFVAGDRIKPLGLSGTRKVKDVFIDYKVPKTRRARFPVVVLGSEVAWLPGLVRGQPAKVTDRSRHVLHVVVRPLVASNSSRVLASKTG